MKIFTLKLLLALLAEIIGFGLSSPIPKCYFTAPLCPNKDVQFWLYTKETSENAVLLDPQKLTKDLFPNQLPLKILIHGLGLNHDLSPSEEVRPLLLQHENVHVISVDYSNLTNVPCYFPFAVRNARVVGKCLASLIENLVNEGVYTPKDIHLIGFSLGAQVAGFTGKNLNFKIKRITGLDPAGPSFDIDKATERLDSSDAEFVDVIHSDPTFFSIKRRMGHIDFYPNYKEKFQPGCQPENNYKKCNHFRSNKYYAESIKNKDGFLSYNCGSTEEFENKKCDKYKNKPHASMGYYVNESARGAYFLKTNPKPPYAQGKEATA